MPYDRAATFGGIGAYRSIGRSPQDLAREQQQARWTSRGRWSGGGGQGGEPFRTIGRSPAGTPSYGQRGGGYGRQGWNQPRGGAQGGGYAPGGGQANGGGQPNGGGGRRRRRRRGPGGPGGQDVEQ